MKQITQQTAQALANLRGNPDFVVILEWITENRTLFRDECCTAPLDRVSRAQGKVEVVNGILDAERAAPIILDKFKRQ